MNAYIITGTSRGLGNTLAKKLTEKNNYLFCISRRVDKNLIEYAKEKECNLEYIEFDLSKIHEIENIMNIIVDKLTLAEIESISLINNAGTISPVKTIEDCRDIEIINNINVNLLAPIILTSSFIKLLEGFQGEKRIINISSGAGKKPYHGWSNYCASKAGINLFTQSVGLEQQNRDNPVKIISIAPFIMDTEMQEEIRRTDKNNFEQVERFIGFEEKRMLLSTDYVAEKIQSLLNNREFLQGGVIDVRDIH